MPTETGAACMNNMKGEKRKRKLVERKMYLEDQIICMRDQIGILEHEISLCS